MAGPEPTTGKDFLVTRPGVQAQSAFGEAMRLHRAGKLAEAVESMRQAVALGFSNAHYHNNLGTLLAAHGQHEEAAGCYRHALGLSPDYPEAWINLAGALRELGQLEEAIEACGRAIHIQPQSADAHNALGVVLLEKGEVKRAAACCRTAVKLRPQFAEAHFNLAISSLALGDFGIGWCEYEWRRQSHKHYGFRELPQPRWDGSDPAGKTILLTAEQGLGDTFQFVRYAQYLAEGGAKVLLECQPPLRKVLERTPGVNQVIPGGQRLPAYDLHLPLLSLPSRFGTTLNSVPTPIPYLFPDPALEQHWKEAVSNVQGFKIGIAWQPDPGHPMRKRACPLSAFARLAALPGVRLISLQKKVGVEQLKEIVGRFEVTAYPLDEAAGAFMDTAALMKSLDLVIAVDTAVAHLAGGMGVKAWVMLPYAAEWRWMQEREDSPWYPTMRLFRQRQPGDWHGVMDQITQQLETLL